MAEVIHRYIGKGQSSSAQSQAELRRKAEKAEADRDFVEEKTLQTLRRRQLTEVELAKRRGELIAKDLVIKQACFLLTAMRQRILQIPHSYAPQLPGITDAKVMSDKLRKMSINVLNDIKNLPQQVTDPHWLATLEKEGDS
jgi:hypothetical protein